MDKTLFRLSDNEKARMIEDALNPNYNEAGGWEYDYCVIDTYDEYALCRDRKKQKFVRVSYSKDDVNNTISINGEPEEVFIVDVTQTEYTALMALQAVGGTYEKTQASYTELQDKVSNLETEKATFETEKSNFEAEKSKLEEEIKVLKEEKDPFTSTVEEKDAAIQNFEKQINELTSEKVRLEEEKNNIINENTTLAEFKKSVEDEKKTAIIDEFASHLIE